MSVQFTSAKARSYIKKYCKDLPKIGRGRFSIAFDAQTHVKKLSICPAHNMYIDIVGQHSDIHYPIIFDKKRVGQVKIQLPGVSEHTVLPVWYIEMEKLTTNTSNSSLIISCQRLHSLSGSLTKARSINWDNSNTLINSINYISNNFNDRITRTKTLSDILYWDITLDNILFRKDVPVFSDPIDMCYSDIARLASGDFYEI